MSDSYFRNDLDPVGVVEHKRTNRQVTMFWGVIYM
jgi:hypothetical protein